MISEQAKNLQRYCQSAEIEKIADHYGLQHQLNKTNEELAELIQAIQNYSIKLALQDDDISVSHMVEEMADVKVMIAQLEYLLELEEEVNDMVEFKLNRQMDRIKLEKESVKEIV